MSTPSESPPVGRPRLSKGFWVNILTASTTMGFRVDVLAALEFPRKRRPMASVNREWSSPNTPDAGVNHNNIRGGLRTIDDGRSIIYGMRPGRGWFETPLLGVVLLSSRIRKGLMNKKIPANDELWRFP
jgi:hypothetical protein